MGKHADRQLNADKHESVISEIADRHGPALTGIHRQLAADPHVYPCRQAVFMLSHCLLIEFSIEKNLNRQTFEFALRILFQYLQYS